MAPKSEHKCKSEIAKILVELYQNHQIEKMPQLWRRKCPDFSTEQQNSKAHTYW